jgi:Fur family peroxide stress response transcriptional regulator
VVPLDDERVQEMMAGLRAAGHRLTPQRLAVVRALVGSPSHPSADQVYSAVVAEHPGIGLATIYNTLELLQSLGQVMPLDFGEGRKRYDARRPEPHAHLICAACGRVEDVDGLDLAGLPVQVASRTGYQVLEHRFDLRGLCPTCQTVSVANQS